jgi:predicted metalloprotease with PDZ domain
MTSRIARSTFVVLLFSAFALQAEEAQRCNATAQECERDIRRMLSGRRYFGLVVHPLAHGGIVVKETNNDSPAQRANLRQGDRIIAVNGRDMTLATAKEFKQALADAKTTGTLFVIIQRRGAYMKIDARLEPFPKSYIDKIVAQHLLQSHLPSASASAGQQP